MKPALLIFFCVIMFNSYAQQPITPQKDVNGYFSFQVGNTFFQVNPNHGARITSHKLDGSEFLWVSNKIEDMYGSTCWLSPQSLWGWPPQKQIDTDPYTGGISGNKVILTSGLATAGNVKFQIRKTFSANLQDSSVSIMYTIINKSTAARSYAVWEIMRVPTGGLSLFPVTGSITGDLAPFFNIQDGIAFWDYDSTENNMNKAFADGNGGWLAHVNNTRLIQIKKFPDTQSNFPASSEKEIEFYAESNMNYNEIEKHTDYKLIPVEDSSSMAMTWFLRKLPDNIPVKEGSSQLVDYVLSVLNSSANYIKTSPSPDITFTVYPNPSLGEIEFHGPETAQNISFTLMNILGEKVKQATVSSGEKIQLGTLHNGIYLYKLQSEGIIYTGKLIIRD
jgi:hypothetical protein